jgi:hypothetical protein
VDATTKETCHRFPFSNAVVELRAAGRSKGAPVLATSIAAEPKEFDNHHVSCSIACSPFVYLNVIPQAIVEACIKLRQRIHWLPKLP